MLVLTSTYPRWTGDHEPGFVHELARRLTDRFDVTVLGPHAMGARPTEVLDGVQVHRYRYAPASMERLVNDGGIVTNLRRSPWRWLLVPPFLIAQAWATLRFIRKLRPDVVHAHWLLPQGLVAACVPGRPPVLVTSHGADLFAIRGRLYRGLRSFVLARVAAVSVVSRAMRSRLRDEHPGADAHVMPMGVDFGLFTPSPGSEPAPARSTATILFVGRLVAKKGVIHLIDAMPQVLQKVPEARLDVIGFGPEQAALAARVEHLGLADRVTFLGAVPQAALPAHYRAAAVFAAPFVEAADGDQEGLGLVVAEAIACHCPVVVGDVPAVRDVVDDDLSWIVPQNDPAALADALVDVLRDADASAAKATLARNRLLERLSWQQVAAGYADLLSRLAQDRSGS
ncbi:glycosyltransferase family 4 protein [Lysobacter psychrotolerans]|uniref:Glycosyltransferase family 4 protein n=1 Tax=Montanilutibacter psychrotolerans TaxID=1327343 RepID=A0A3M8STC1_9GAMM|nr:glycosyltransferase family 4 protein [Lysobacter psychrotolerans]